MLLEAGGINFQIHEFVGLQVVLEELGSKQKKLVSEGKLIEDILNGIVIRHCRNQGQTDLESATSPQTIAELRARHVSDASIQIMLSKVRWVRALHEAGVSKIDDEPWVRIEIQKLQAGALKSLRQFELSTLKLAERKLAASGGDVTCLIPSFELRGGKGKSRLAPEVETIIDEEIRRVCDEPGRIIKQHVIDAVQTRVLEESKASPDLFTQTPGASTISRRISVAIPEYELFKRRNGTDAANDRYRQNGVRFTAERPLEVSETDDIDAGVFLLDLKTGLPCGRAFITSSIDQFDGVPLGMDLSFLHRSTESAINCVLNGLAPKDINLPEYSGQPHPWIGYGTAGLNIMDNATYNHASEAERVQLNLRQSFGWSRPDRPTDKSSIEHYNHMVKNGFCARLDGWSGDEDNPNGSRHGMEGAIYDIVSFKRQYVSWVTGEYLNKPGDDGLTPKQRREPFFRHHKPMVRWTREQIEFMYLRPEVLTFRASGGLLSLQLRYQSDELQALQKQLGFDASVLAFTNRKNLDFLIVKHPHSGALLRVPCIEDRRYVEGMTERQQQLVLKKAYELGMKNPDMKQCVFSRRALAAETERLRHDKRLRRRHKGVQNATPDMPAELVREMNDSRPTTSNTVTQKEVYITDLEFAMNSLDEIDVSGLDWSGSSKS